MINKAVRKCPLSAWKHRIIFKVWFIKHSLTESLENHPRLVRFGGHDINDIGNPCNIAL